MWFKLPSCFSLQTSFPVVLPWSPARANPFLPSPVVFSQHRKQCNLLKTEVVSLLQLKPFSNSSLPIKAKVLMMAEGLCYVYCFQQTRSLSSGELASSLPQKSQQHSCLWDLWPGCFLSLDCSFSRYPPNKPAGLLQVFNKILPFKDMRLHETLLWKFYLKLSAAPINPYNLALYNFAIIAFKHTV